MRRLGMVSVVILNLDNNGDKILLLLLLLLGKVSSNISDTFFRQMNSCHSGNGCCCFNVLLF